MNTAVAQDQLGLAERFGRGLELAPDGLALRVGNDSLTYRQLHELALRWAGAIVAALPDTRPVVGVLAAKGVTSYAGVLAALYAGATVVPLHPGFPAARTEHMLDIAEVAVVVVDDAGLAALAEVPELPEGLSVLAPGTPATRDTGTGRWRVLPADAEPLAAPLPARTDTAYVLFTSGSTGRPKGVPISHHGTRHYFSLLDERYDFDETDAFSQTFDLNFDCAMFDMFCAWGAGAAVHAIPPQAYRDLPAFLAERGITVWFSTPSAISLVARLGGLTPGALPTLRWSFFAGEALRDADARTWHQAAPRAVIENIYGPTELTVTITGHRWLPASSPGLAVNGLVPIGSVHAGHQHLLLADDCSEAADEGELCIGGPQLTAGYLDPAQNEGRFLRHGGELLYRTGDRVRTLPNGELCYLGRLDSQVQIQGWRVELAEIEHALRGCPGVTDAVALARDGAAGTELVVFHTGEQTPPAVLARRLRGVLPAGMLPREYRWVAEFPLNSNRKVDRLALARSIPA